ncbi:MAG: hypothetical protein JXA94_06120 [Parachlamydiales bacterium]|nr:hypothetical protein [Parachlamydiales bacterium]
MSLKKLILSFGLLLIPFFSFAVCEKYESWFCGPFVADSASNADKGMTAPSFYLYYVMSNAVYDNNWNKVDVPNTKTIIPELSLQFGMTTWLDITFDGSINSAKNKDSKATHWRDVSVKLGFQLLKEKTDTSIPSLRFVIKEIFPTGKYQNLNPEKNFIDSSGTGSYITMLGLNASKVLNLFNCHLLKLVGNIQYYIPSNVHVDSINIYNGLFPAYGIVYPGKSLTAIFAFDFSFTQRFAFSMDILYTYISKTRFSGNRIIAESPLVPITGQGEPLATAYPPTLASGQINSRSILFTLSPAIEYDFSDSLGIIATYWFSFAGKNISTFKNFAASISYSF